jgi:hypothetical protein
MLVLPWSSNILARRKADDHQRGRAARNDSAFNGTTDIAFASNGHLFITDGYGNNGLLEYTADGKRVKQWGKPGNSPGEFRLPHAIQIDEEGTIYVADRKTVEFRNSTSMGNSSVKFLISGGSTLSNLWERCYGLVCRNSTSPRVRPVGWSSSIARPER